MKGHTASVLAVRATLTGAHPLLLPHLASEAAVLGKASDGNIHHFCMVVRASKRSVHTKNSR